VQTLKEIFHRTSFYSTIFYRTTFANGAGAGRVLMAQRGTVKLILRTSESWLDVW
jgi:hypothetical protein